MVVTTVGVVKTALFLSKTLAIVINAPSSFKSELKNLKDTVDSIIPMFHQIESEKSRGRNFSAEFVREWNEIFKDAKLLIEKSQKMKWWKFVTMIKYKKRMKAIEKRITRFCQVNVQLEMLLQMEMLREDMRNAQWVNQQEKSWLKRARGYVSDFFAQRFTGCLSGNQRDGGGKGFGYSKLDEDT